MKKETQQKGPVEGIVGLNRPKVSHSEKFAKRLREQSGSMMDTYVAYNVTENLLKECSRHGDYKIPQALEKKGEIPEDESGVHIGVGIGWWYESRPTLSPYLLLPEWQSRFMLIRTALGLRPSFNNWAQITFIHMFMLQVRFRMLANPHATTWIQHLTNHAFYAAEDRLVVWHKIHSASIRQKYLKDTFAQWRGVLLAYDEGLMKGDAVLAAAIWRNLLSGKEDVDFEKLAQITAYMRREIRKLTLASDEDAADGTWVFEGDPGDEAQSTNVVSRLMREGEGK